MNLLSGLMLAAAVNAKWTDNDDRRRSGPYFSLPRSCVARPLHGSQVGRRGLPPTVRARSQPGIATAPTCAHRDAPPPPPLPYSPSPRTFPVRTRPSPHLENPSYSPLCSQCRCLRVWRQDLRRSRGPIARQRSTRSRRTGSTNTVSDMSIDWIVLESSTTPGRFKGIGTAPIRTTQTATSAAVVRSSVAIERQEESPREVGGLGREEVARGGNGRACTRRLWAWMTWRGYDGRYDSGDKFLFSFTSFPDRPSRNTHCAPSSRSSPSVRSTSQNPFRFGSRHDKSTNVISRQLVQEF